MKLVDAIKHTMSVRAAQYPSGKVVDLKVRYVHWNKQFYVQAKVRSASNPSKYYKTQIVFNGVKSSPKRTRQHTLKYIDIDGSVIWIERPNMNHNILTRDTCEDFRFMWHWELADRRALLGPRIPYTPVPGSNRPPKNPDEIPGICKHVLAVLKAMMGSRVRLLRRDTFLLEYLNRKRK